MPSLTMTWPRAERRRSRLHSEPLKPSGTRLPDASLDTRTEERSAVWLSLQPRLLRLGPQPLSRVTPTCLLTWRPFAYRSSCRGPLTSPWGFLFNIQGSAKRRLPREPTSVALGNADATGSHPTSLFSNSLLFCLNFYHPEGDSSFQLCSRQAQGL